MRRKTIVLATAFTVITSFALAQPAPIGSSADFGNGAVINRGPVTTTGEDLDFRTNRSSAPRLAARPRRVWIRAPRGSCGLPDYYIVPRYCYDPRDDRVDTSPYAKPVAPVYGLEYGGP
jgi:hypothetical protein